MLKGVPTTGRVVKRVDERLRVEHASGTRWITEADIQGGVEALAAMPSESLPPMTGDEALLSAARDQFGERRAQKAAHRAGLKAEERETDELARQVEVPPALAPPPLVSIDALVVLNESQAGAIRALGEAPRPTKLDHVRWGCSFRLDLARQVPRETLIGAMLDSAFVGLPEQRLVWPGVEPHVADGVPPPLCPGGPRQAPYLTHRRGHAILPTEASRFPPFAPAVDALTLEDRDIVELDHGLLPDKNSPACKFG